MDVVKAVVATRMVGAIPEEDRDVMLCLPNGLVTFPLVMVNGAPCAVHVRRYDVPVASAWVLDDGELKPSAMQPAVDFDMFYSGVIRFEDGRPIDVESIAPWVDPERN